MVDDTQATGASAGDTSYNSTPPARPEPQRAVSKLALLISFAAGAFATWIIMANELTG